MAKDKKAAAPVADKPAADRKVSMLDQLRDAAKAAHDGGDLHAHAVLTDVEVAYGDFQQRVAGAIPRVDGETAALLKKLHASL